MAVCKLEHLFVHTDGRKCCPPATQVAIFKAEMKPVRPRYHQSTLRRLKQITCPSRVHSTFHLKFYLQKDPEDLTKSKNAAECPSKKPFSQQALVEKQEVPESRTLRHATHISVPWDFSATIIYFPFWRISLCRSTGDQQSCRKAST